MTDAPALSDDHPTEFRRILAWASWDWGSASFNAVITTFVFTVWLTSTAFVDDTAVVAVAARDRAAGMTTSGAIDQLNTILAQHSSWLGYGLGLAGLIIALTAPLTGSRSDAAGGHRRMLTIYTALVVVCMAAMWFVRPSASFLLLGIALVGAGNVFFELASVNYNSLLTTVASPRNVGRVSGFGWGMGYLGGIVLLTIVLVGFVFPDVGWFGVSSADGTRFRAVALLCALWMGVFALPTILGVPTGAGGAPGPKPSILESYRTLVRDVVRLFKTDRNLLLFLLASAVFRDGLAGVFTFGGVLAAGTFGFSSTDVIIFAIVANVVAGIATIATGAIEDRVGAKRVIMTSLIGIIVAAALVFALSGGGPGVFWGLGLVLCLFVGPAQSASRTFLARIIPEGREGEIFGLYATTGRAASFLAPTMFGIFVGVAGHQVFGILGIALVLAAGAAILVPVSDSLRLAPGGRSSKASSERD